MSKITFSTSARDLKGKKAAQLRAQKLVLGNVYGASKESIALQFPQKKFLKLYEEVGDTGVVYLKIKDSEKEKPTLIDEVQIDPVSNEILHVSFKEVNLKEKIEAEIPVELVGEFDMKEAVLVQVKNTIVVEALPNDLPEKFEINVKEFTEVGQSITLADLKFDKTKISLVEVEEEEDWANPVVLVQEQRAEETAEEEPAEVEAGGAEKAEEGAAEKSDTE